MSSKAIRRESLGRSRLLGGALVTLMCVPALAGPQGEKVVSGRAKFKRNANRTVIRAADNTIINYSNFDIGINERVRFIQPGANARVLNRIRSDEPTRIDGMLRSNGQVYIGQSRRRAVRGRLDHQRGRAARRGGQTSPIAISWGASTASRSPAI